MNESAYETLSRMFVVIELFNKGIIALNDFGAKSYACFDRALVLIELTKCFWMHFCVIYYAQFEFEFSVTVWYG